MKEGNLQKKYKVLVKKIDYNDLFEMLIILHTDPKFAVYHPDSYKIYKDEIEHIEKKSENLGFPDDRRDNLLVMLDKEFHLFDEDKIHSSVQIKSKIGIDPNSPVLPKVLLLIDIIKSTLALRKTGKEIRDDRKIKVIECFTSDQFDNDYKIVINEEYDDPLDVSKSTDIWGMFFTLVQDGYLDRNSETKRVYDYLNFNKLNLISTNTKYPIQVIIKQNEDRYTPLFKYAVHTEKTLSQRKNKLIKSNLLKNT